MDPNYRNVGNFDLPEREKLPSKSCNMTQFGKTVDLNHIYIDAIRRQGTYTLSDWKPRYHQVGVVCCTCGDYGSCGGEGGEVLKDLVLLVIV